MNNTVELIDIHGDDLGIALAAWYSTSNEITEEKYNRVETFIARLAKDGHTVPFEHNLISFRVTSDIATHIQCLKHRIGISTSSQSQRYMELKDDLFYIPEDWPFALQHKLKQYTDASFDAYHQAVDDLVEKGFSRARAKESARYFLQYNTQIRYKLTFNFHSFAKFQKLRNDEHAQLEIRNIAIEMLRLVSETGKFKYSIAGWGL